MRVRGATLKGILAVSHEGRADPRHRRLEQKKEGGVFCHFQLLGTSLGPQDRQTTAEDENPVLGKRPRDPGTCASKKSMRLKSGIVCQCEAAASVFLPPTVACATVAVPRPPSGARSSRGCDSKHSRARPKRCLAWVSGFVVFFVLAGQRGAGEQAEQNEKRNENETKNTVEVGP